MPVLRPEPALFDLQGWKQYLADLRADPVQDSWQQALIDHAKAHISAIDGPPEKTPVEAP